MKIKIKGVEIEVEKLSNGKYRKPDIVKVLQGSKSGMQLKPAVEVVLVVQKPLQEKSYIDQTIRYADEMMNKEQFIEEYDVRNIFQDKLLECSDSVEKTFPFLIVPKASKSEKNKGLDVVKEKNKRPIGVAFNNEDGIHKEKTNNNHHPTVKPVKLMTYLITLATRPEDIVLDPFMGSGTTGIAAKLLGRQFIGIEFEKEYMRIAEARIKATETLPQYIKNKFWE